MASIYADATIVPNKTDLLRRFISSESWSRSVDAGSLSRVGAYRFDDPDGEVGIETHLVEVAEGKLLQIPFTYRNAEMPGGQEFLIATAEHSVLGTRWIYDGLGDPVFLSALATCILCGGRQADLENITDSSFERAEPKTLVSETLVSGTGVKAVSPSLVGRPVYSRVGATTIICSGALQLTVLGEPEVGKSIQASGVERLVGTWPGQDEPTTLALAQQS
jgi:hypothetical protein